MCETENEKVRVLLVDDHPVVREGLRLAISSRPEFHICGSVADSIEATKVLEHVKPHAMVLDLGLKEGSGLDFIKQLQVSHPDLPILVLSALDESDYAERSIRAGAKGYIMKGEPMEKLVLAMVSVAEGRTFLSEAVKSRIVERIMKNPTGESDSPLAELSDRELQVFAEIGTGLNSRQIAEKLALSPKTVEAHCANIKRKLKLEGSSSLLRAAIRWTDTRTPV
ncbi:MAG: response regulator transcription factor [Fibrobacteria bacterium]